MGEKRQPVHTVLLRKEGKTHSNKIEIFTAQHFGESYSLHRFRLRVDGAWWPKGKTKFFTKTQIKELVFHSIKLGE